jgi:uncharacterized membrane protein
MAKVRILLAGESWVSAGAHTKGFDQFHPLCKITTMMKSEEGHTQ